MPSEAVSHCSKIVELVNEIKSQKDAKRKLSDSLEFLRSDLSKGRITKERYEQSLKTLFGGSQPDQAISDRASSISALLGQIKDENYKIYSFFQTEAKEAPAAQQLEAKKPEQIPSYLKLSKEGVKKYLEELDISADDVKKFIASQKKKQVSYQKVDYIVYKSSTYAKIANRFVEPITMYLIKNFPDLFKPLFDSLKIVSINMLTKSYVSTIIFSSILAFVVSTILFSVIFLSIPAGLALGLLFFVLTFIFVYFYPSSVINTRRKRVKNELPFAIIHMAAVAGSGTQPLSIFTLLLESGEYSELNKDLKKILNYVNIYGYNLTTALKAVASTTPSPEFKELLNGIISSIETGGDLRSYLDSKAADSLATYKLERNKQVETIATYSDIYTGILVAAPLLFVTTLTIINVIGGGIGGLSAATIAEIGTFVVIPVLNIGFIIFLNLTQSEI